MYYSEGISWESSLLEAGLQEGIITKSGAWFSYGETKMGQGRDAAREFFKKNPQLASEIERKVKEKHNLVFTSDQTTKEPDKIKARA